MPKVRELGSARAFASKEPSPSAADLKDTEPKTAYEKTINQVTILGRVGHDPLKKGTDEHPAIVFSVATHNNYRYESGEFIEKTDWHRVVVFRPSLRDLVFSYLKKGQRVYISGKISYGSVTEGTVTRPTTSIIADDVIFFYHAET